MRKQRVKNLAKFDRPQGLGLASASQSHGVQAAKEYAFLLLKFRLRSELELKARLKQKGFSQEIAQEAIDFLKDKEFIDDRIFARGWVSTRLKRPFGLRKIKQELVQKGVDKEIIEDSLACAKESYDENQIVSQLAQKRFSRIKGVDTIKAKARVYAYLIRRGFASDTVAAIVKKL
ncbi:MAG: regulatory protein RecX [Candidatus Omnitrophota bacterium]